MQNCIKLTQNLDELDVYANIPSVNQIPFYVMEYSLKTASISEGTYRH